MTSSWWLPVESWRERTQSICACYPEFHSVEFSWGGDDGELDRTLSKYTRQDTFPVPCQSHSDILSTQSISKLKGILSKLLKKYSSALYQQQLPWAWLLIWYYIQNQDTCNSIQMNFSRHYAYLCYNTCMIIDVGCCVTEGSL